MVFVSEPTNPPEPQDAPAGEESELPSAPQRRPVLKRIDGGGVDEDHALVEAAKAGDQRAFSRLFERHHGRVFAMCTRLLADRAEVEDAVQQTFLEAWRCLHRFEGRSRFTTWLTRIAIHTSLGFRRRVKRLIFSSEVRPEAAVHDIGWGGRENTAPDQGVHERNRKQALTEILQRLTAKKRVVFVLAELEGMTAPEISEILKIPDATVRTRLFHARKEFAVAARNHPAFAEVE
jgi:RNA polymerase sigma-70 factor (ECF subfamily)